MQFPIPICLDCRHFFDSEDLFHCVAFPEGIPREIITSEFDHHNPHPDDNGIQFEAKNGTEDRRLPT